MLACVPLLSSIGRFADGATHAWRIPLVGGRLSEPFGIMVSKKLPVYAFGEA